MPKPNNSNNTRAPSSAAGARRRATGNNNSAKKPRSSPGRRAAKPAQPRRQGRRKSAKLGWRQGVRHWFRSQLWKWLVASSILLAAYGFYLNAKIVDSFAGGHWQVPAQIYARPMRLNVGAGISRAELLRELQLLGYRQVAVARRAGEYSVSKRHPQQFEIVRRPFVFADGFEAARHVRVSLRDNQVQQVLDLRTMGAVYNLRLEPWLLTRLVSDSQEDRLLLDLQQAPEALLQALILTEDRDFYHHQGVAPSAIARAFLANVMAGRTVQGGSTITQQLVKNLYLTRDRSLWRKLQEAAMALIVEWQFSKDDIMQTYLNEVFLGQDGRRAIHGFGLASYYYFDRPLQELSIAEISTLVAMVKGPSRYNPRRFPARVAQRRDLILRMLYQHELISAKEYEHYVQRPLGVVPTPRLNRKLHPAYVDQVQRELRRILPTAAVRQAGVKVFTGLDPHIQRSAEQAATAALADLERSRKLSSLQVAMVVTDIDTGEVRAVLGGRDMKYRGFNRAIDAKRHIGSTLKPIIYLTALAQSKRYYLGSTLADQPIKLKSSFGNYWAPKNADLQFRGEVTLLQALSQSLNVPAVHLGMALGTREIAATMGKLGIRDDIPTYPAMILGAVELSPWQVSQMYQTIANQGGFVPAHAINAVLTSDDELLWQFDRPAVQVVSREAAYLLNYGLQQVTQSGTAKQLSKQFPGVQLAGKTGTTDDHRDSWYSGFDKDLQATIWVGKDNNDSTQLSGASGALRVYSEFQKSRDPRSIGQRARSRKVGIVHIDPLTGAVVSRKCRHSMPIPAIVADLPRQTRCRPGSANARPVAAASSG